MAAHLKTGLEQVVASWQKAKEGELTEEHLRLVLWGAINISCWTEDDPEDYCFGGAWGHIRDWLNGKISDWVFEQLLFDDLARATAQWERLGQPANREEWLIAKYPELAEAGE